MAGRLDMAEPQLPEPEPESNPADGPDGRKAYVPPELVVHGTIQDLTQAQAGSGGDNNPGFPNGSTL